MPTMNDITIVEGPDVKPYPETARITSVRFTPGDFFVRHTKEGKRPDSWPGTVPPGWDGPVQWTLWVVVNSGQGWVTAGCLEYWPEEPPRLGAHKGGDPAPFSVGARNWWYNMPVMNFIQPQAGDTIGIFVTQGSQRKKDVCTVRERSNVVWVTVPKNDTGEYVFQAPDPKPQDNPPAPHPDDPGPSDPGPSLGDLKLVLENQEKILAALHELMTGYQVAGRTPFGTVRLDLVKKP